MSSWRFACLISLIFSFVSVVAIFFFGSAVVSFLPFSNLMTHNVSVFILYPSYPWALVWRLLTACDGPFIYLSPFLLASSSLSLPGLPRSSRAVWKVKVSRGRYWFAPVLVWFRPSAQPIHLALVFSPCLFSFLFGLQHSNSSFRLGLCLLPWLICCTAVFVWCAMVSREFSLSELIAIDTEK